MQAIEQYVQLFSEIWSDPDPARFPELFDPEGTLLHPGMTERLPASEVVEYIAGVKAAAPDLHLVTTDWAVRGDTLYIDWTMHSTFEGEPFQWDGVDKFTMRDGRALHVTAYFDTHPLWVKIDPTMQRGSMIEEAALDAAETAGTAR